MLHNLINRHDLVRLLEKLEEGALRKILGKVFRARGARVQQAWQKVDSPPIHWWDIPEVRRRWNSKITGDERLDHFDYFAEKYFGRSGRLVAVSPGCGRGDVELRWARTGVFARIEAFDLSPARIAHARRQAQEAGLGQVLQFAVKDIQQFDWPESALDVVIFEGSLHHFRQVEELLGKVARALKPDGFLFLNEFVGPARFQWSDRQLEAVNGLLQLLPERLRVRYGNGRVKRRVYRPGRLWMYFSDPSEAVESDRIRPAVRRHFEPVEEREYGGTVLNLLFSEIAHNFLDGSEETAAWLKFCFEAEDLLLEHGELSSDYLVGLYRPRPEAGKEV